MVRISCLCLAVKLIMLLLYTLSDGHSLEYTEVDGDIPVWATRRLPQHAVYSVPSGRQAHLLRRCTLSCLSSVSRKIMSAMRRLNWFFIMFLKPPNADSSNYPSAVFIEHMPYCKKYFMFCFCMFLFIKVPIPQMPVVDS